MCRRLRKSVPGSAANIVLPVKRRVTPMPRVLQNRRSIRSVLMRTLEDLSAQALNRDAARPAIEYLGRWYGWGELREVADRVSALLAATGASSRAPVAFIARN